MPRNMHELGHGVSIGNPQYGGTDEFCPCADIVSVKGFNEQQVSLLKQSEAVSQEREKEISQVQ